MMAAAPDNPMLSVLTKYALANPDHFTKMLAQPPKPIAFSNLPWTAGSNIQAKNRLLRTKPAPKNQFPELIDMLYALDPSASSRQIIDRRYLAEGHGRTQFNFVEALRNAIQEDQYDQDMSCVVDDPCEAYPGYLEAWIFGPRGEFTNFAVVDAFEEALKPLKRAAGGYAPGSSPSGTQSISLTLPGVSHISFVATLIYSPYDPKGRRYNYGSSYTPIVYIRFKTYDDYAEWNELAARDHTRIELTTRGDY